MKEALDNLDTKVQTSVAELRLRGIDSEMIDRFAPKHSELKRRDKIHGYLDYVLSSRRSFEAHLDYIRTGKMPVPENSTKEEETYLKMSSYAGDRTVFQLNSVLQDETGHQKSFQEAIEATQIQIK